MASCPKPLPSGGCRTGAWVPPLSLHSPPVAPRRAACPILSHIPFCSPPGSAGRACFRPLLKPCDFLKQIFLRRSIFQLCSHHSTQQPAALKAAPPAGPRVNPRRGRATHSRGCSTRTWCPLPPGRGCFTGARGARPSPGPPIAAPSLGGDWGRQAGRAADEGAPWGPPGASQREIRRRPGGTQGVPLQAHAGLTTRPG